MTVHNYSAALFAAFALTACQFATDDVDEDICVKRILVSGEAHGFDVSNEQYQTQSIWFNSSIEEVILTDLDRQLMEQWGLDDQSSDDALLFKQFTEDYDVRTLISQLTNVTVGLEDIDGLNFQDGQLAQEDLGIYFFEMEKFAVQPSDVINVFDLSELNSGSGLSREERGIKLRQLIGEMLSNSQPDAVVAYAPDRSNENANGYLVNLFAQEVYFAKQGYAQVDSLMQSNGSELKEISYPLATPLATPVAMTTKVDAQFDIGDIDVEAECIGLVISGSD